MSSPQTGPDYRCPCGRTEPAPLMPASKAHGEPAGWTVVTFFSSPVRSFTLCPGCAPRLLDAAERLAARPPITTPPVSRTVQMCGAPMRHAEHLWVPPGTETIARCRGMAKGTTPDAVSA